MNNTTLWQSMKNLNNITTTENGEKAYHSTLNPLLDFMFKATTYRDEPFKEIFSLFSKAYHYNNIYAIRLAFYVRDVRGGQGERNVFRACMMSLAIIDPNMFNKIINYIPEYGRWDDVIDLFFNIENKTIKENLFNFINNQFITDFNNYSNNKEISLLAKWLPSENASSQTTKAKAKLLRKYLKISSKEYRQKLSKLRKYINIVETKMTKKAWNEINYNAVPSKAMMKYRAAFSKNDFSRYREYLNSLINNTNNTKINASTLYPFDIISKLEKLSNIDDVNINLFDAQWNALPDYFGDKFDNALVVCDTSGSMSGIPINVAIGLSIYIAERNKGIYNNKFITFSNKPELQEIVGNNIFDKYYNLLRANWDMNTDINKVYELIYNSAIQNKLTQKDLPSMLYIISDMQFDSCVDNNDMTTFNKWQQKFIEAGYKLPTVVFWNVRRTINTPITIHDTGAILCSGYSPSVIKYIMDSNITDTNQLIENIVNGERYASILAN